MKIRGRHRKKVARIEREIRAREIEALYRHFPWLRESYRLPSQIEIDLRQPCPEGYIKIKYPVRFSFDPRPIVLISGISG